MEHEKPNSAQAEAQGEADVQEAVVLKSWAYPHMIAALRDLAGKGKVDLADPQTLVEVGRTQAWGTTEVVSREGKKLEGLVFGFEDILNGIPSEIRDKIAKVLDLEKMRSDAEGAIRQVEAASGSFGYDWLEKRSIMARYLYIIACKLQNPGFNTQHYDLDEKKPTAGKPLDELFNGLGWANWAANISAAGKPEDESFKGDRKAAEALMNSLYGYGWEKNDNELQEAIARFELQLGIFWCTQMLGIMEKHNLDPVKLTEFAHRKYGLPAADGSNGCYWDGGCPCMCGARWEKMEKPSARREDDTWQYGMPEMDRTMWAAYGGARNSAFAPLMGVMRALSEGGGEEAFVEILLKLGSDMSVLRSKMGSLMNETQESRHVVDYKKNMKDGIMNYCKAHNLDLEKAKEVLKDIEKREMDLTDIAAELGITADQMKNIETSTIEISLYSEAADAAISWPCLVAQAFGLNFTRSVQRAFEFMAKNSGTTLMMPEDISRTVPVDKAA